MASAKAEAELRHELRQAARERGTVPARKTTKTTTRPENTTSGTCPICGKGPLVALGAHTRTAHGKGLKALGLAKRPGIQPRVPAAPSPTGDVLRELNGTAEFQELHQFKVLQDRRGNVWLAERIR